MGGREAGERAKMVIDRRIAGLLTLCEAMGHGILEPDAKLHAPWKDRTGNARQGLHGGAYQENKEIVTYLAHSVDYGVHLEKRFAGRYAIIRPVISRHATEIIERARKYWNGTR